METDKDVVIQRLKNTVHELELENARYKRYRDLARKYEFRITGAFLIVIGAVIAAVAYPSYSYSNVASLLLMLGAGTMFIGTVVTFLNTERFMSQKVVERLNLSSVIVLDKLLRDLRLKNKGVYIPSSKAGGTIKIFVPLKRTFELPPQEQVKGSSAFLIGLPNNAQEGVLLPPLGYDLFKYTNEELHVAWNERPSAELASDEEPDMARSPHKTLSAKLNEVLVKGLSLADKIIATESDGELHVRLKSTSYAGTCRLLMERAPQVCEQIGCPLCSLIACIYTEYVDNEVIIDNVEHRDTDIELVCLIRQ